MNSYEAERAALLATLATLGTVTETGSHSGTFSAAGIEWSWETFADLVTFSHPQWRTRRILIRNVAHYVRVWLGQANGLRAVEAQGNAALRSLGIAGRYGVVATRRRVVRIGDDHLVPERLEVLRDPLALGRGFEQDARSGPAAQQRGEPLPRRADALFADDGAVCLLDADLGFLLVHVHANIRHGWPPLRCGIDRV